MATDTILKSFGDTQTFARNVLMASGATETDRNGRYFIDGSAVNVELSETIAEVLYVEEIFRDGQSVTAKYTADRKAAAVRVLLDTPYPFSSRTLSYGGRKGTPGNAGVINVNPPLLPAEEEFTVPLNQVNDQILYFPDVTKEYIPLDMMAKKIAGYSKSVTQDRTGSTLAEILAYSIFRALNDGENLNTFVKGTTRYADLLASLNSKLDNGDIITSAFTFSTEGRTIIGRPSFINGMFSSDSSVFLVGSDLAQEMLRDYDLSKHFSERGYVGRNYKGKYAQFHFQSAPDYIWTLAEKYLGLPAGALNNVYAVAVSYEATALGRIVDLGVKLVDSSGKRGLEAQPLNVWGHTAFRKSQIIGDATLTNDYFAGLGFADSEPRGIVAPSIANSITKIQVPIYAADGVTIVGYREIAEVPKPNGGNIESGVRPAAAPTFTPNGGTFTTTQSVTLTAESGAKIFYTTDGSTPTDKSTEYTAPISLTDTATVNAIAVVTGKPYSDVASATFTKAAAK